MNTLQTPWFLVSFSHDDVCITPYHASTLANASLTWTNSAPAELDMPELDEEVVTKLSNRVILFNDEWHSFDEVIEQIIKATGCSYDKAEDLTWEVHNAGKAMVYEGDMGDCLRVSNVLEEIKLRTQIEC
ncbi:MAG: ATP-dependent Clp protease adaptor ClpS [Candidatus Kapaibacteriota bacterium]|jgi:ATP-dependent Clp protease adapter protein ClpS